MPQACPEARRDRGGGPDRVAGTDGVSPGSTEWALPRGPGAKSLGATFLIPFSSAEPEFAAEGRGWGEEGG